MYSLLAYASWYTLSRAVVSDVLASTGGRCDVSVPWSAVRWPVVGDLIILGYAAIATASEVYGRLR